MESANGWIDDFLSYTKKLPSPEAFCLWAGIAVIAGALERRCFLTTGQGPVYPNLYTLLVGPPGVGKTEVTSRVQELWMGLEHFHVAASSLTRASLADQLSDSTRQVLIPGKPTLTYNSLLVCANELGVFLPAYESDFMNTLTDIYDGKPYSERRRGNNLSIEILRPQLNILSGTTPSYLNGMLPAGAWDQGFLSRTIVVYSGQTFIKPLFESVLADETEFKVLKKRLDKIANLSGEFVLDDAAKQALDKWHLSRPDHEPNHPKLINYNTRRTLHLLKLAMVACVSKTCSLNMTEEHVGIASDWLISAERYMPDVFKSMNMGGDSTAIQEAWYYAYENFVKTNEPIPESEIYTFLQERVPAHSVERIISVMVKSGILTEYQVNKVGTCYKPKKLRT